MTECPTCKQDVAPAYHYCPWCGTPLKRERVEEAWNHLLQHDERCATCKAAIAPETYPANFDDRCLAGTRLEGIAFTLDRGIGLAPESGEGQAWVSADRVKVRGR